MSSVAVALELELGRLGSAARDSTLAASARSLAALLDDPDTSANAAASLAKELREHLAVLRELDVPDAAASTSARLAGRAASKLKVVR